MAKRTIEQVDVAGRRVLMRVDFNVPLDGVRVTDDRRIRLALPTIRSVLDRGGRLVLMSHLGRPGGKGHEPALSLEPAAARLGELLEGVPVRFVADDCVSAAAAEAVEQLEDGSVLVLQNLRFNGGETSGDAAFAGSLAAYGDIYAHEAFGTAHRGDASVLAVPRTMAGKPRVAGLLLDKELRYLSDTVARAGEGFVALLGGAKVSDKLGAIANLIGKVEAVLIGGAMAYTFLKALGQSVGSSLVEPDRFKDARETLEAATRRETRLLLPNDHVCGKELTAGTPVQVLREGIPEGWMGLDIGPETVGRFGTVLEGARTIVWNGPVGAFETPPFDAGTRAMAEAIAAATGRGATTVVGGGDSAAAVERFGLAEHFSHVSTGGGASLQMLEGRRFESVELLDDAT
jgi:phosphoglycerate kinase